MRRALLAAALLGLLGLVGAAPAQAGLGGLIRAAAKIGGKAGTTGAKSAKLAKGGAALKGAAAFGTLGAGERVFVNVADEGSRVAMFVASDGTGALKVVTRGGDELAHTPGSLRTMVGEMDEMAAVADDVGVDLYLDPAALDRVADLEVGSNTRLFLANTDGPSWRIHSAADGAAEVAVGGHARVRIADAAARLSLDVAMRLAQRELRSDELELVAVDGECAPADGAAEDPAAAVGAAQPGDSVVLVVEPGTLSPQQVLALADSTGVELVVIEQPQVCSLEEPAPNLVEIAGRMARTATLAELWSIARDEASPLVIDQAQELPGRMVLSGSGFMAVHGVPEMVEMGELALPEEAEDDLPEPVKAALGALILVGFLGGKFWLGRRKARAGE